MPRQYSEPRRSDYLYQEDYRDACKAWRREQQLRKEYYEDKADRRHIRL